MGFEVFLLLLFILVLLMVIYVIKSSKKLTYWKKKGVAVPFKPYPIIGNVGEMFLMTKSFGTFFSNFYFKSDKKLPYFGYYSLRGPVLFVKDLELIRAMFTKDFVHFSDHNLKMDEKSRPMQLHLFNLTGEKWKNMRVKLTPTFTTSKIKFMFNTVAECNNEMLNHLKRSINENGKDVMDMKDLFATLNTDVIGSCAFGIECNSFKDPDAEFRNMGKKIFESSAARIILRNLTTLFPFILKHLIPPLEKEIEGFFYNIVEKTIDLREKENITRNDFMQLLINLKKDENSVDAGKDQQQQDDGTRLTTMQIAAQVFVFFIAGFETSSTTASFALYELALNPDIQDTLRKEIDKVLKEHDGNVTYDALAEMSYLGMVIDETLRKYPPLPVLFRICTKEYTIPGTDIIIEKDTPVMVPVMGIQRDPDIYPNPDKFDPERFTPENKASRHHFAYMPFGEGPRICIGSRFGLMQTKLGLVSILSKYEVSPCEKTLIPMKYDNRSFILAAEGGVWLKLIPRSK